MSKTLYTDLNGTRYVTPLGGQPDDLPHLGYFNRDLQDVAVLIKKTKRSLKIHVKDIGTKLTEKEGEEYLKFIRLLHHMGQFDGFNLSRKDRIKKTACFCCGYIDIELCQSDFQERGQKLFRTDWIKEPCANHDHNTTSPSDGGNLLQPQHLSGSLPSLPSASSDD